MNLFRKCLTLGAVAIALTGFGVRAAQAQDSTSPFVQMLNLLPAGTITTAATSAPPLGVAPATPVAPGPVVFFN